MNTKISIIGAGRVGESTAQVLAIQKLAKEIVLIDIDNEYAQGVALDIQETASVYRFDAMITGSNDISKIKDSKIVIIAAGVPRKPGMSRDDVLSINIKIIDKIMDGIIEFTPESIIIMVTNPVDALTYFANKKITSCEHRIMGQAGVLDSMRMSSFVAMETGYSVDDIHAMVMGGHGDSMVPLIRFTAINGIPIEELVSNETIKAIIERTRGGGAEILNLKKKSSAYNAPGAAVAMMVESIIKDKRRLLPCISMLNGEYGHSGLAIGVPIILGKNGIEKIIEVDLNEKEIISFEKSAQITKNVIKEIGF